MLAFFGSMIRIRCLLVALICFVNAKRVLSDIGTATSYGPPYLRKFIINHIHFYLTARSHASPIFH